MPVEKKNPKKTKRIPRITIVKRKAQQQIFEDLTLLYTMWNVVDVEMTMRAMKCIVYLNGCSKNVDNTPGSDAFCLSLSPIEA